MTASIIAGLVQLAGYVSLLTALVTGVFLLLRGRGQDRTTKEVQTTDLTHLRPPTWAEMQTRQDQLENKLRTLTRRHDALRDMFVIYVERVQNGGTTVLTERERHHLYDDEQDSEKGG